VFGFIKKIFGSEEVAKSAPAPASDVDDLANFVDYIVRSLVDAPSSVVVDMEEVDETTVIKITCDKDDVGKVVGKRGKTIMAIRSLVSGAAGRLQKRVNVEVVD